MLLGPDGEFPFQNIIQRINDIKKDSKVIAVFSAPLTLHDGKKRSLTDVVLEQGRNAENGIAPSLDVVKSTYQKIVEMVSQENREGCKNTIDSHLSKAQSALDEAYEKKRICRRGAIKGISVFRRSSNGPCDEPYPKKQWSKVRMRYALMNWPIITDNNIESTNFLAIESLEQKVRKNCRVW